MTKTINKFFIQREQGDYYKRVFRDGSWIQYKGSRKTGRQGRSNTLRIWWKKETEWGQNLQKKLALAFPKKGYPVDATVCEILISNDVKNPKVFWVLMSHKPKRKIKDFEHLLVRDNKKYPNMPGISFWHWKDSCEHGLLKNDCETCPKNK